MTEELPVKKVDFSDLGFWDVNLNTMEITLCERAKEIFAVNKEYPVSLSHIFKRMVQSQIREFLFKLKNSFSTGNRFTHELALKAGHEGELRRIRLNGYVDFNNSKTPIRIIGAITELPEAEETGLKKTDLLAMVSHELKSPLTTIKLYIQLAEKTNRNKGSDMGKYLSLAVREVDNMNLLMDNFLNLTSIETGSLKLYPKRFDLSSLISEVVDHWTRNTLCHRFRYDEGILPMFINADQLKIRQVIHNLISNAVKYSSPKSKIEICCKCSVEAVEICVKDQGEGISEEDQDKLFTRFSRVGAQESGAAGHGMGLYLVREIIAGHGGRVWLNSKVGEGSEFYISLPRIP